ncbi:MAG: leucyl aminopeptidase [bacterium]|nr:leucyl aminopeptidase [bacterium]
MKIRHGTVAAISRGELVIVLAPEGARVDAGPALADALAAARATGDLRLGHRKSAVFHQPKKSACKRLGVVGLGRAGDLDPERLRRAAAVAQGLAAGLELDGFSLVLAKGALGDVDPAAAGRAIAEGLALGAYRYDPPRQKKPGKKHGTNCKIAFVGPSKTEGKLKEGMRLGGVGAAATAFARDIENLPGNLLTPSKLASHARSFAGGAIRTKVLDKKAMEKLGMHSMLGVARGSTEPPKFLVMEYRVPGAKQNVCVVGKGITFDSGGISLKPGAKMDEMRYDMCGAGAVMGFFHALKNGGLGKHKPKCNIIGLVAATENMPDGSAQKPGDVVRAMDGQTIEILNTDAEGRLVLADAICYAKKFYDPKKIVDLATLTGAVVVALGHEMAGIMGNDQDLVDELIAAGERSDEPLWQLPLWECHRDQVRSKFADVANLNGPQFGNGSTAGGAFLSFFAGDTPWVHLDIAGAAYGSTPKDYYKSGATGTAVRTLLDWARTL